MELLSSEKLNDAELSFFWKLWLLFVLGGMAPLPVLVGPTTTAVPAVMDNVDPGVVVEAAAATDGALYVVNPWAVGGQ